MQITAIVARAPEVRLRRAMKNQSIHMVYMLQYDVGSIRIIISIYRYAWP